jgi:predicted metal-binding membrane protein
MRVARGVSDLLARPPWPITLVLAAAGWLLLTLADRGLALARICGAMVRPDASWNLLLSLNPPATLLGGWLAMLLAMLPPMLALPLRTIWRGSLHRNRLAKCAAFVFGYAWIWLAAGALVLAWLAVLQTLPIPLFTGLAAALIWHASPGRQRCLNACHRQRRLHTFGFAALADALGEGFRLGFWCIAACLPLMSAIMLVAEWHLAMMFAAALFLTAERMLPPAAPRWFSLGESLGLRLPRVSLRV